jgi:hypothetical protein
MTSGIIAQPLIGHLLNQFVDTGCPIGERVYSAEAHQAGMLVVIGGVLLALLTVFVMRAIPYKDHA